MSITITRDEEFIHLHSRDLYLDNGIEHVIISFWQLYRNVFTDIRPVWKRDSDFRVRIASWTDVEETSRVDHRFVTRKKISPSGEFDIYVDIDIVNYLWWYIKMKNPRYQDLYNLCHSPDLKERASNSASYRNYRIFKSDD